MNHITQEQAVELVNKTISGTATPHGMFEFTALCNAAIEWYIAQQAAPTHVWAATSKTMQVLFATEADARKMQPTATSPFDVQRVPVFGAQAAPTKEQT